MTRVSTIALAALGLILLASPSFAAGSGHEHGDKAAAPHNMPGMEKFDTKLADTAAFGKKGDPARVTRTLAIEAIEIAFSIEAIEVKAGETIRFVLTNKGEQPHELTIGDEPYQEVAREMMTHMAEMGMDLASAEHTAQHASAGNTVVVPVGETKEIVWTFSKPGRFEFSCNMPGHAEVGMKGPIAVN